jgi:hypothetical protein
MSIPVTKFDAREVKVVELALTALLTELTFRNDSEVPGDKRQVGELLEKWRATTGGPAPAMMWVEGAGK